MPQAKPRMVKRSKDGQDAHFFLLLPLELDYELNCTHRQEWHCLDSAEEMMTSGDPTSASALSTDNVPDPETISFNSNNSMRQVLLYSCFTDGGSKA